MNKEADIDQTPKSNDTPEDVNENASQDQTIEQSQSENMEVHHHPHVSKKNFKEYFLEFLMIFLAVTLGFFAEGLREHLVNVKKEKEYIITLKEDLLTDTSSLSHLIPRAQLQLDKLDSLCILLNLAANKNTYDIHRLYYLNFRYSFGLILFQQNERTISQIKSTGAFNLIENKACKDSITFYYNFYDGVIQHEAVDVENWMTDLNKMSQTIFDYSLIKRFGFRGGADIFLNDSLPQKLINSDSIVLREYMNKVRSLMMMLDNHLSLETSQFDNARKLISLLNKEYHLQ